MGETIATPHGQRPIVPLPAGGVSDFSQERFALEKRWQEFCERELAKIFRVFVFLNVLIVAFIVIVWIEETSIEHIHTLVTEHVVLALITGVVA